jgi:hypothetical protein
MTLRARPVAPGQPPIELSEAAQEASAWLRLLARGLRTFRIYRGDNPVVVTVRTQLATSLAENLSRFGGWQLRFTPNRVYLEDEPVIQPDPPPPGEEVVRQVHHDLPFIFYRDGIRRLTLLPGIPSSDIQSLFEALTIAGHGPNAQDDLVTLLWQANLTHVRVESVPLEQTIYLSSRRTRKRQGPARDEGQVYAWAPTGSDIRADLGQEAGTQGLHLDTFDDWELPWKVPDVREAYARLLPLMEEARVRFPAAWARECEVDWTEQAPVVMRRIHAFDPSDDARYSLSHATATWLAATLHDGRWSEAEHVLGILREFDPNGTHSSSDIGSMATSLDVGFLTEKLDEAEPEDHARFAALVVALGPAMIRLAIGVLAGSQRVRVRAAASAALTSLCAEQPELLAPYLTDPRWHVVRNVVFVLGQIGGPAVVGMLGTLTHHPEPRVRRQIIHALGSSPVEERTPILIAMLDAREPQILSAALQMLIREPTPEFQRALLERIQRPDFEYRSEELQRTIYGALAEIANDDAVPVLETVLHRGGWFAKRTLERYAAARVLARIATERARSALDAGLRSKSEAVRQCCLEALSARSAA